MLLHERAGSIGVIPQPHRKPVWKSVSPRELGYRRPICQKLPKIPPIPQPLPAIPLSITHSDTSGVAGFHGRWWSLTALTISRYTCSFAPKNKWFEENQFVTPNVYSKCLMPTKHFRGNTFEIFSFHLRIGRQIKQCGWLLTILVLNWVGIRTVR